MVDSPFNAIANCGQTGFSDDKAFFLLSGWVVQAAFADHPCKPIAKSGQAGFSDGEAFFLLSGSSVRVDCAAQ